MRCENSQWFHLIQGLSLQMQIPCPHRDAEAGSQVIPNPFAELYMKNEIHTYISGTYQGRAFTQGIELPLFFAR